MIAMINKFAEDCVDKGYITKDQVSFLVYKLECTYVYVVVGIPFFLLGIAISSPVVAVSFYIGFYYLRTRISGYHAKGIIQCLLASLAFEVFFLSLLFRFLTIASLLGLLVLSVIVIILLAPYRDPNINFTEEEYIVCAKIARKRTVLLLLTFMLLYQHGQFSTAKGLALGAIMATTLLVFAYLNQKIKEFKDEKTKHYKTEDYEKNCTEFG